jgi:3-oxoadipate enol-lactonase
MLPHHVVTGPADAPVLVLAPSLGATLEMWEPQVAALSEQVRLVRCDTRGHGRSAVPPGPYTLADLGGDLVELLDALELERASVCGISLGGMTAIWLGAHAPERMERLVLCCTAAYLPTPEVFAERAAAVRAAGSPEVVADGVVARWLTPAHAAADPALRDRLRAMIATTPAEGYASCCDAVAGLDERSALPSIAAPTLVIGGAEDPSIPPEHQRAIAEAIPGARLEILDGAAHLANLAAPHAFNALVLDHLGAPSHA